MTPPAYGNLFPFPFHTLRNRQSSQSLLWCMIIEISMYRFDCPYRSYQFIDYIDCKTTAHSDLLLPYSCHLIIKQTFPLEHNR